MFFLSNFFQFKLPKLLVNTRQTTSKIEKVKRRNRMEVKERKKKTRRKNKQKYTFLQRSTEKNIELNGRHTVSQSFIPSFIYSCMPSVIQWPICV